MKDHHFEQFVIVYYIKIISFLYLKVPNESGHAVRYFRAVWHSWLVDQRLTGQLWKKRRTTQLKMMLVEG